ncbi:MAG: hypothetical protein COT73_11535 [Bdellovibrio sp. CG10_big_fil_rev_8_21_14_0_10_47_8]|nr:MAG: hypothetical protein COT73_11535 [Bdellovibrio sp. CG10_big_fil_rev_8_21_14_0_10_47_8]
MSKVLESFGKYLLLEKIAAGGMAEVYLAKSTGASGIAKFLAVKRILPQYSDHPEFIDMFKEEAKIAVNLNHNNIVSIFDFGVKDKQFFLVMEYVEGQNLRQVTNHLKKESRKFSIDQIVYITKEVAGGLDHAHRCLDGTTGKPLNITHRDMSPQNIMVSFEGEIKIVDFGIAKAESQLETTRAGTIKGKFGYMSPEQADGQPVDLRADIFALGIVLWELLANDRLFTTNSEAATLRKIRECQIPSLRKLNPSIPPELERICIKALAKDKSLRYQTAAAFHRDLNRFLNTQYPEFSPHDFSVFMKSAFSQMFIENRRKLIEYAKVQSARDEGHTVTEPGTVTKSEYTPIGLIPKDEEAQEQIKDVDFNTGRVNLKDLKIDGPVRKRKQSADINSGAFYQVPSGTRSGVHPPHLKAPADNTMTYLLVAVLLAVGGYGWNNRDQVMTRLSPWLSHQENPIVAATESGNVSSEGQADFTSKQAYVVFIDSNPSGARIFIDNQDSGMLTPARKTLDAGRDFTLSLRRDGYQYYEKRETANTNGKQINATLLPLPKMGYINLDLFNAGSNPVIVINGQRVDEKLPLRNYAVPAGTPVRIQVHNPFSGLSAEQVVRVELNQRVQVKLILSQRKPSNSR